MGYSTRFELTITNPDVNAHPHTKTATVEEVAEYIHNMNGISVEFWQETLEGVQPEKWYEHVLDMTKVSQFWPRVLFTLHGIGEEDGDEWVHHFKMGFNYFEKREAWTPPPFDANKLQGRMRHPRSTGY